MELEGRVAKTEGFILHVVLHVAGRARHLCACGLREPFVPGHGGGIVLRAVVVVSAQCRLALVLVLS